MKRSFSIGLTATLIVLSHLPRAHAAYDSEAWARISFIKNDNVTWASSYTNAKAEIWWDENSSSIYSGANYSKDEGSPETDVLVSAVHSYAKASAGAVIPASPTDVWAEVFAGASDETGKPGPYSWGQGTIALERQFTVNAGGTLSLEFKFEYGLNSTKYGGAGLGIDTTFYPNPFVPIPVLATGESYITMTLTKEYYKGETGTVRLYAAARAYDETSQCPPIPAPVAVVLASLGVVTVVVLRRRRVI